MIFGGMEDERSGKYLSRSFRRMVVYLAPFLTGRSTCQIVYFLRERLRTDRTDASRGVTPKKPTAVRLPITPCGDVSRPVAKVKVQLGRKFVASAWARGGGSLRLRLCL